MTAIRLKIVLSKNSEFFPTRTRKDNVWLSERGARGRQVKWLVKKKLFVLIVINIKKNYCRCCCHQWADGRFTVGHQGRC